MLERSKDFYSKRIEQMKRQQDYVVRLSQPNKQQIIAQASKLRKQDWKRYRLLVWELTNKQNLATLEGFEMRNFVTHQIDHKVSVWDGFKHELPAEWIAHISNLRMITGQENGKKGMRSLPDDLQAMINRKTNNTP